MTFVGFNYLIIFLAYWQFLRFDICFSICLSKQIEVFMKDNPHIKFAMLWGWSLNLDRAPI
jgi:hypothetical protein